MNKKILFLVVAILMAFAIPAAAQVDINLTWDHTGVGTDGFELLRYQVVHNPDGTYELPTADPVEIYDVAGGDVRTFLAAGVPEGAWAFAARAYAVGDPPSIRIRSDQSNYANAFIPPKPAAPTGNSVSGALMTVMFSLPSDRNATLTLALDKIPDMP